MAEIEQLTRLARLLIAPPFVVYDELKTYGNDVQASPYTNRSDELERALARRNDPLIDLGLAAYASNRELVGELYRRGQAPISDETDGKYKQGLRLAVLANQTIDSRGFLHRFPENVIGEANLAHVLKDADWLEAEALILNPTLSDDVLIALYRNDGVAAGIDEGRRRHLVLQSAGNGRLNRRSDTEHGPDMRHYDVHRAIVEMLETVPTSKAWLGTLSYFLQSLDPGQVGSLESIDPLLDRWKVDENGAPDEPDERRGFGLTELSEREEFRCLLASFYGKHYRGNKAIIHGTAEDEDVTRRCAFYGSARLDRKLIEEGRARDGDVFVLAALANDEIFLRKDLRRKFEECLDSRHTRWYRERCEQIHRRWKSFDPRPAGERLLEATPMAPEALIAPHFDELQTSVRRLERAVGLLPWYIVALGLLLFWRS